MALITYADKDKNASDNIRNEWRDVDANEVKNVVNANAAASGVLDQLTVSTTSGVITLDFASKVERMFLGSASIGAVKTWALSNASNAIFIPSVKFTMTTTDIQTFPSTFKMASFDANWDSATLKWTPPDVGTYEMSASFDGTYWLMKITGPFV